MLADTVLKAPSIRTTLLAFILGFATGVVLMYFCSEVVYVDASTRVPLHIPFPSSTQDSTSPTSETLVLLIFSGPNGTERRYAVRETWLQMAKKLNVTARFLIGTDGLNASVLSNLTVENEEFNDMLLFPDVHDSFRNLTLKLLKGIIWAKANVEFDYFMKADDDTYIRLDKAIEGIRTIRTQYRKRFLWGYFVGKGTPRSAGKYEEHNWLKCPHYFPYSLGACYILAKPVLFRMTRFSDKLYTGYSNDDVSMSSWLAPYDIVRIHDLRFTYNMSSAACNRNYIASHLHNASSLHEFDRRLVNNVTLCDHEVEAQHRYAFNWTAFPSLNCCWSKRYIQLKPFEVTRSAFSRSSKSLNVFN